PEAQRADAGETGDGSADGAAAGGVIDDEDFGMGRGVALDAGDAQSQQVGAAVTGDEDGKANAAPPAPAGNATVNLRADRRRAQRAPVAAAPPRGDPPTDHQRRRPAPQRSPPRVHRRASAPTAAVPPPRAAPPPPRGRAARRASAV